jgi:Protein tyrosine phosphatase-like protein, PTPLA
MRTTTSITERIVLISTNTATCLSWLRVLVILLLHNRSLWESGDICENKLRPALFTSLAISTIELVTALCGFTRSKPLQVLLFASVRTGTEVLVTPLIGCTSWQHLFTVGCWSLGEVIRFGCFALDGIITDSKLAKSIRYFVGPILFPLGASGEMCMVLRAASMGRGHLYLAAFLWPAGFYPLMRQLLRQRRKHFAGHFKKAEIKQI